MPDPSCHAPPPDDEIEQLTAEGRRRTASARATYREQVKAEALHLEALRVAMQADLMNLTGDARRDHIERHMNTLSAADIDALTAGRMRTIMAERGRASALVRRRARLERLRARLGKNTPEGGTAA
jgi:hypothetical protein